MSYLIVGGNHQQQKQKINKICRTLSINFSPNQPDCLILRPQKSIGIEQVRQVKNFLNKKSWQGGAQKIVVVSPGAANHTKRWKEDGFAQVCDVLIEDYDVGVIFVGDEKDKDVVTEIIDNNGFESYVMGYVKNGSGSVEIV